MGVFDTTAVDLSAKTGGSAPPPSTPPGEKPGEPAAKTEEGAKAGATPETTPKEHPPEVKEMLDRYGLTSLAELNDFLGRGMNVLQALGDADPQELIQDQKDLRRYRKEWAKQERDKAKAGETPEQTIERLEREAEERERNWTQKQKDQERARKAQENLSGYDKSTSEMADQVGDIDDVWKPVLKAIMGVKSPVNALDITDRKKTRELMNTYAVPLLKDAITKTIERYRSGKANIPVVPDPSGAAPAVTDLDPSPKNLTEARKALHVKGQALLALLRK